MKTEVLDLDLRTRNGRTLPVRLYHKVAFGADGAPGADDVAADNHRLASK